MLILISDWRDLRAAAELLPPEDIDEVELLLRVDVVSRGGG